MSDDKKKALAPSGLAAWGEFLKSIASGVPLTEACLEHRITTRDIDAITRSNLEADKAWRAARLAAERCSWPQLHFDDIFERIEAGTPVIDAVVQVRGRDESAAFFRLIEGSEGLTDRFYVAQRQWAMKEALKLVDIADDDTHDTLPGPKGGEIPNMAAVQRDRLRIETRRELLQDWHPRMFGRQQKTEVTVNFNLVERMERGIANVRAGRVVMPTEAIDAAFTPVEAKPAEAAPEPAPGPARPLPPVSAPVADPSFDATWRDSDGPTDVTTQKPAAEEPKVDDAPRPAEKTWYED